MKWEDRSPEEKRAIRKKNAARKAKRAENDAYERAKQARRSASDKLGERVQPGDWLRYQEQEFGGYTCLYGKVCRVAEWDDDGYNDQRAGRNKKIIIEIEPHLSKFPKTMRTTVQGFHPVDPLTVLAEAAQ